LIDDASSPPWGDGPIHQLQKWRFVRRSDGAVGPHISKLFVLMRLKPSTSRERLRQEW